MKTKLSAIKCLALILLLVLPACSLLAQNNMREGYVITLQGDTLNGEIDFRTSAMNSAQCVFLKDGSSTYTTYLPGEIKGYRFRNNGIYYVSKEIDTQDNGKELVFAEYVIRGNMNLYQVGEEEMVLEDEEGNQARFSPQRAQRATKVKDRQAEMKDALGMLTKSTNATNIIWTNEKNRENTKQAVIAYIDEVCADGYCEVFEYASKTTPKEDRTIHPWVKAGYKMTLYKFWNDETIMGFGPQISAGLDFHLDRTLRGLMITAAAAFEIGSASQQVDEVEYKSGGKPSEVDFKQLDVMLGPGYQFKTGSLMTHVKCGVIYRLISGDFNCVNSYYSYIGEGKRNVRDEDTLWEFDTQIGLYAGAGVEYPLKKCALICDLDYIYDYNKWSTIQTSTPDRTVVHQHGLCLSLGVKF